MTALPDQAVELVRRLLVADAMTNLGPMDSVCAEFDVLTPDGVREITVYVGPGSTLRQHRAEIREATWNGTLLGFVLGVAVALIGALAAGAWS